MPLLRLARHPFRQFYKLSSCWIRTVPYLLNSGYSLTFLLVLNLYSYHSDMRPTVDVSCGGWERGLAVETGKAQSQTNAQKTRCVPTVSCTGCWAAVTLTLNIFHIDPLVSEE